MTPAAAEAWRRRDALRELSASDRWIAQRLIRRGYKISNPQGTTVWLWLPLDGASYNPCDLFIGVGGTAYLYNEASFRTRDAAHVHVKAVLNLRRKDWSELEAFEATYRACHRALPPTMEDRCV